METGPDADDTSVNGARVCAGAVAGNAASDTTAATSIAERNGMRRLHASPLRRRKCAVGAATTNLFPIAMAGPALSAHVFNNDRKENMDVQHNADLDQPLTPTLSPQAG
jgi:hypothetical protein